ncbi:MAG: hypothetical protein OXH15_11290 [Gammaproteobacteria bacterium]|nr:hypothetical protein [Gammaproteobacteria bacterium]
MKTFDMQGVPEAWKAEVYYGHVDLVTKLFLLFWTEIRDMQLVSLFRSEGVVDALEGGAGVVFDLLVYQDACHDADLSGEFLVLSGVTFGTGLVACQGRANGVWWCHRVSIS